MAAPRGGSRCARAGGCADRALSAAVTAWDGAAGPGGCHRGSAAVGGFSRGFGRRGGGGGTRRNHRPDLVLAWRSSAAGDRRAAGVVLAGHRPGDADRRPAAAAVWLPVHPRGGRLGGAGRPGCTGRLRQLRWTAACCLFPGRSRAVGDPGRAGGRGRPRRAWHTVADQLPPRCRSAHGRRRSAGSQHRWPAARAAVQASGRVPHRAGDQPRPAAGTSGPAGGDDRPTSCGIQPPRRPVAPLTE